MLRLLGRLGALIQGVETLAGAEEVRWLQRLLREVLDTKRSRYGPAEQASAVSSLLMMLWPEHGKGGSSLVEDELEERAALHAIDGWLSSQRGGVDSSSWRAVPLWLRERYNHLAANSEW